MLSRDAKVGLGVIALMLVILGLVIAKPHPLAHDKEVWATFRDAATIASLDRNVRVAGANVGRIGRIERRGDAARVQLLLDDTKIRVASDATAELRPHLAFEGNSFIELFPGSPSAPDLRGDIPLSHTRNYVSVDKVLRVADAPTRDAIRSVAGHLDTTLADAPAREGLRGTLRGLGPMYRQLLGAARAARGTKGDELAGALRGLAQTTRAVAAQEQRIVPGLQQSAQTFAALDTSAGAPLGRSLAALPSTLAALNAGSRSLTATADRLRPLAVALRPGMSELARAEVALDPLLRRLSPVLRRSAPVVGDLRQAVRNGGGASKPVTAVLRDLQPTLDPLDTRILPGLHKPTRLGAPLYDQILRGFLTGFDGALMRVQTASQATSLFGTGPGFDFDATASYVPINGLPPTCSALPGQLQDVMNTLKLCKPS